MSRGGLNVCRHSAPADQAVGPGEPLGLSRVLLAERYELLGNCHELAKAGARRVGRPPSAIGGPGEIGRGLEVAVNRIR